MKCPLCQNEIKKPIRSLSQNALYWLYLHIIERETGNTSYDLHEFYKRTKLPPKFIKINGKEIKIPSSTRDLSKIGFGEYMDKISADCEIPIPDPHELPGYICGNKSCPNCPQ